MSPRFLLACLLLTGCATQSPGFIERPTGACAVLDFARAPMATDEANVTFAWPYVDPREANESDEITISFYADLTAKPGMTPGADAFYDAYAQATHYWGFAEIAEGMGNCLGAAKGVTPVRVSAGRERYNAVYFDAVSGRRVELLASQAACRNWSSTEATPRPKDDCLSVTVRKARK